MEIFKWAKKTREREIIIISSISIGLGILIFNFIFFSDIPQMFTFLSLIGASIALAPPSIIKYSEYRERKEIERRFPDFIRDIVESIRAGMTLPQAIKSVSKNDYGFLSPHVKKIAAQMDWGIPFHEILIKFSEKIGSKLLRRAISTIIETHESGGNINNVLEATGESILAVEKIKKERSSRVYAQMVQGYFIFFIFIGVIILFQVFLMPYLTFSTGSSAENIESVKNINKLLFQYLIIIQGIFSGIAIGKMAEGTVLAGLKHSIVLVATGYSIFLLIL